MSRAPFIAIQTDIRKEERVLVIAEVGGYSRHEALGRLVDLWAWCADRRLKDAPEDCAGYAVTDAIVRRFLGLRGVEAILGDGCDALALGERRADGLIHLRGTGETVRRLRAHARTAVAGGEAREARATRQGGRFVSESTNHQQATSRRPAGDQQATSGSPAVTSVDPRSQIPDPQATNQVGERETPAAPAAPQARRRARLAIGPDWTPERSEANLAAEARARAKGLDLALERSKLIDWATSRDERKVDWGAAWRYWLANARGDGRHPTQSSLAIVLNRLAEHEREEAETGDRKR